MNNRFRAALYVVAPLLLAAGASTARASDDATLLRVFLTDGSSLVSYGEPARVADRVVFSMPTAATPNPPLQLISLASSRVDWERTNRYAASARATHYIETQGELDYAELSSAVTKALNDVGTVADPARRLALVEDARKMLASWPQNHFNYRQADIRDMMLLLDEAIADLQAARGASRFNLSFTAYAEPPLLVEPLPPLTPKDAIEQVLLAAHLADTASERVSLLTLALGGLDRDTAALPAVWSTTTRATVQSELQTEQKIDREYQQLTQQVIMLADRRARLADVRGLERLVDRVHESDRAMGGKRAESVTALVAAVQARLDSARQLQLLRDRWALRAPVFRRYRVAIRTPLSRFAALKKSLEAIKSLAGSPPATLAAVERAVTQIVKQVTTITPPDELQTAHALLISAFHLAANAARIRREATMAADVSRAWDASSAAAGSLMLAARAETDIQTLLRPPQLQ